MRESARQAKPSEVLDDIGSAYHEAGHAVAMWRLGYGVEYVTIDAEKGMRGHARHRREPLWNPNDSEAVQRAMIEKRALFMLAGDVTTRFLRPDIGSFQSGSDHNELHRCMSAVEENGSVQMAWCGYLWQRTYTFMHWPGQRYLVIGLAQQLLEHRTLVGDEVEQYLRIAETMAEIRAAVKTAGIALGPDTRQMPYEINPGRWSRPRWSEALR